MDWIIKSPNEMIKVARSLAPLFGEGDVIALKGTLGVGKTTFVRALIQMLTGKKTDVPSPTFTLLQTYDTPKFTIHHFDFYRLKNPEEAYEIGIEDAFESGVCLIEWPEKIANLLPSDSKSICFEIQDDGARHIWTEGF